MLPNKEIGFSTTSTTKISTGPMEKKSLKILLKTVGEEDEPKTVDIKAHDVSSVEQMKSKLRAKNLDSNDFKATNNHQFKSVGPVSLSPPDSGASKKQRGGKKKSKIVSDKQPLDLVVTKKKQSVPLSSSTSDTRTTASNECRFCGKFYATEKELKEHEVGHTVNKELTCPQCGIGFARRSYLAEHACIHKGEKHHKCYYCSRAFTLRCNLVRHVRIHTGEKPFQCNICQKDFILKKNMIEHRRIHTGEKPFKCDFCTFSFSRRSSLVRHSRIHTGEKLYQCHECQKTFSWKYYLQRHIVIHLRSKTRKRRRRCMKKKDEDIVKHPPFQETVIVNCGSEIDDWGKENFVEHSYAMESMESPEESYEMDENSLEIKQEEFEEAEFECKEEICEYEGTVNVPTESTVAEERKQLTVIVTPVIMSSHSAINVPAGSSLSEDSVVSHPQSNDYINFKMTPSDFENFCGRKLRVRLHRLEDVPSIQMHEE